MSHFKPYEKDRRTQKRKQEESVFGSNIRSVTPTVRNYTGRKEKVDNVFQSSFPNQGIFQNQLQNLSSKELRIYSHDQDFLVRSAAGSSCLLDTSYRSTRRSRIPCETFPSLSNRSRRTSESSVHFDDGKTQSDNTIANQPIDLIISNLDHTIKIKELKKMLANMLKEFTAVSNMDVIAHSDGTIVARVRVSNPHAAQFMISQIHRQKLGLKRMVVSYAQSSSPDPEQLRAMAISILQEEPDMPLFKFIELLDRRYHYTVSLSEVNKLKDICQITDNQGSRIISLTHSVKTSPPPNLNQTSVPYCTIHCSDGLPKYDWCELNISPNVMISLRTFATKLNGLLNLHMGSMPLLTFQACYEQEYQEPLPFDVNGVPLEHIITCVADVKVKCVGPNKNIKIIKREMKCIELDEEAVLKSFPPSLASNIGLLCRELVDLLKTMNKCQLPLSKFIPAYHHHFGRQCHVADYGYTKLVDLLEAISHVTQIMGDGSLKIITLSHQAQMRRFTSDLLRVLKVQPSKHITGNDFPVAYEKVLNKPFNPVDYGLCTFRDLLEEVPENIIVIVQIEEDVVISVPKREQTGNEIVRTKQFAMEVIDILKHAPNCTMLFNKFVPAYHHHFGHQCRVSDYGFTKLIDLFEAIPDVVKVQELSVGERAVSLTLNYSLKILGTQIVKLLKNSSTLSLPLAELPRIYVEEYGSFLKPQAYECESVSELVKKIRSYIQVTETSAGSLVALMDTDFLSNMKIRIWALLLKPPYKKMFGSLRYEYQSRYNSDISLNDLKQLSDVVWLSSFNNYIVLTDLYVLAAQLYQLLYINGGSIMFNNLERQYLQTFERHCRLSDYNIYTLDELYQQFDFLFFICGYKKSVLALNRNLAEYQIALPLQIYNSNHALKRWPPSQNDVMKAAKKYAAPKPDTPPTPNTTPWSPSRIQEEMGMNLSLKLPIILNPPLLGNPFDLISPARPCLYFNKNPWEKSSPHPAQLPMPDEFLVKGIGDDSTDSGINSKLYNSTADETAEVGACGIDTGYCFTSKLN